MRNLHNIFSSLQHSLMKKYFGQHFLHDKNIARKIANSLLLINKVYNNLVEIGPGNGSLTEFLVNKYGSQLWLIEIDTDLIEPLKIRFPDVQERIVNKDFLKFNFSQLFTEQTGIIGNFPYNISSQIVAKIIDNKELIPEATGMFQREVAERLCAAPKSKNYGRLSILAQTFYHTEILFRVPKTVFYPQPQVESAVIRMTRKTNKPKIDNEKQYFNIVKAAFLQRRKTLKNSLSAANFDCTEINQSYLTKRAEELSFDDFIIISNALV